MITTIIQTIRQKFMHSFTDLWRDCIKTKYGQRADVCVVWGNPKESTLSFSTGSTKGIHKATPKVCHELRSKVGQNTLLLYGVPTNNAKVPHVVLLPTPSMISTLGVERTSKFIKDWSGDSKVEGLIVVKYSVLI